MDVGYVADSSNWVVLAARLRAAMIAPHAVGCESKSDVLRQVADARGVKSTSLRKSLDAESFLNAVSPETLELNAQPPSLPKVLLVRAIYNLDQERGRKILEEDPSLGRTLVGLKGELQKLREKSAEDFSRETAQAKTRRKSIVFSTAVMEHMRTYSEQWGLFDVQVANSDFDIKPRPDLVARTADGKDVAIEIKAEKVRIFPKDIYAILGNCALWERQGYGSLVVSSPSWRPEIENLCEYARELCIQKFDAVVFALSDPSNPELDWVCRVNEALEDIDIRNQDSK